MVPDGVDPGAVLTMVPRVSPQVFRYPMEEARFPLLDTSIATGIAPPETPSHVTVATLSSWVHDTESRESAIKRTVLQEIGDM
jgi:hypothetical protein